MKKTLLTFALLLLVLSGCQTMYVPNPVNIPLMSEGGETQLGLQVASNGYNGQLAFSPTNFLGFVGSGNIFSLRRGINLDTLYKNQYGELGIGGYGRLNRNWRIEGYVGYGGGSEGEDFDKAIYRKIFIQPNIGFSGRIVDAGFSPRFSFVHHIRNDVNRVRTDVDRRGAFFEPQFMIRAGYEQFKFFFATGPAIALDDGLKGDYHNWSVAFGIHLTLIKDYEKLVK